ncbi:hypothetical protein F5884DRAFT_687235 [Xylogone sp. PMI_703]|nr:hypothetical protein F5884DRAFT_687235 [Xylogone sp. PMI_703]
MRPQNFNALLWTAVLRSKATAKTWTPPVHPTQPSQPAQPEVIVRDVAIVGGGASGSYSTAQLRKMGNSVMLIEKEDRLGGHVDTYNDPATRFPVEYGVQVYYDLPFSRDFFETFDVPTVPLNFTANPVVNDFVDFRTGIRLNGSYPPDQAAQATAVERYVNLAIQYEKFIFPGYYNGTDPIPDDLLLPFGEFVAKYDLIDAIPTFLFAQSPLGFTAETQTIVVLANVGYDFLTASEFIPASNNNTELYYKVQQSLGVDVLLSSTVIQANRTDAGVSLLVKTPGGLKIIQAKKLVISFAPTLGPMAPFNLNEEETCIFGKWQSFTVYGGLVQNTGLPVLNVTTNLQNAVEDSSTLYLPVPPYNLILSTTSVTDLYRFIVQGDRTTSQDEAMDLVRESVQGLGGRSNPDIVAFTDHSPYTLTVTNDEIKAGFYHDLMALQGKRSTYYVGLTWGGDASGSVWRYANQSVLPLVLESLQK